MKKLKLGLYEIFNFNFEKKKKLYYICNLFK